MNPQQMAMMQQRMRMQQQGIMRAGAGEPMPNMMSNGSGMEMMGPNGRMMINSMGPNGPGPMGMGGMTRTTGHPAMMQGNGMMHGMSMMGPGPGHPSHPAMQHGMNPGNRPPPPEYGMSQQVNI